MKLVDIKKELLTRELPPLIEFSGRDRKEILADWEASRPTVLELFQKNIYGKPPEPINNVKINFVVHSRKTGLCANSVERKLVDIHYSNEFGGGVIRMVLFLPMRRKGSVPVFLTLSSFQDLMWDPDLKNDDKYFPVRRIIANGYGAALLRVDDAAADSPDDFQKGIDALVNRTGKREPDSWGAIGMWSWAAQRAMDYLETDSQVDSKQVMLVGCSRCGKTALWCSAQDERFFITLANVSGCGGAAVERGKQGERIRDIVKEFPHWFCGQYASFGGHEENLPIDQHFLLALCAPRPLYIASAEEDFHADPVSEYISCLAAQEIYKIYNLPCALQEKMPDLDVPYVAGGIGYHIRTGQHGTEYYDWDCYMKFADRFINKLPI